MTDRIAPTGTIWVCRACGKTAKDQYGDPGSSWDESCMMNAVLCHEHKKFDADRVMGVLKSDRSFRNGAHLLQTAKSLGWPDDGEGALEFMLRRAREVAFDDSAHIRGLARSQAKP